ncbi:hypothetical protein N8251_01810, partial [Alphaproteobacteria bacterium]|nr:hypothetical protein [Alphaproteobacteria bacterium]
NENEESEIIKIGNLNYILKLKEIKIEEVISKEKAKEEIIEKIVLKEINNIDELELDKVDNKLIEKEYFYSDSFLFEKNLNKPKYKIFENEKSGVFIDQDNYYEYRVDIISNNIIPKEQKNIFIQRYLNYNDQKENEVKYYQDQDLQEISTENINYFSRSLKLEDNNLTNEQLENIVLIKKDKSIKIVLEKDIYILNYLEDYLVDSKQIQNLIINIFYNELLNSIKLLYEIEINSELLLQ